MKSLKLNTVAVLLAAMFVGSACSTRYIVDVADDTKGRASSMLTLDTKNYLVTKVYKDVFWDCVQSGEKMTCEKVCDRKDEKGEQILCPKYRGPAW